MALSHGSPHFPCEVSVSKPGFQVQQAGTGWKVSSPGHRAACLGRAGGGGGELGTAGEVRGVQSPRPSRLSPLPPCPEDPCVAGSRGGGGLAWRSWGVVGTAGQGQWGLKAREMGQTLGSLRGAWVGPSAGHQSLGGTYSHTLPGAFSFEKGRDTFEATLASHGEHILRKPDAAPGQSRLWAPGILA